MAKGQETSGCWLLCTPTAESIPALRYVSEWGVERIVCIAPGTGDVPDLDLGAAGEAVLDAVQRSARSSAPDIVPWTPLAVALGQVRRADRILIVLDESRETPFLVEACRDLPAGRTALLVGPRSGFPASDRQVLGASGLAPRHVTLGPRLFSPEAAACAAVALVQHLSET
ncbi:MAG: hypothetical protein OXF78_11215 [Rhodospirillales bacterium]|nr:hypothetical protein [Rhodospirillales bacterium]